MPLTVFVASAFLLVGLTPAIAHLLGRAAGWTLGMVLLAFAGVLATEFPGAGVVEASAPWLPAIDVAFRLRMDGLSFLFASVVLVIGAVVMAYSASYLAERRQVGFYTLMVGFAASMLLLVLADDLVLMFVAWEFTTLCSYLLILRSGPNAGPPATRTLLVTVAGGLALLGAVCLVMVTTGTTQLSAALADPAWGEKPVFAGTVAVLVAVAAMTKSAQFPFHSWLPDAMVAPAPVSAYLHAAAMVKAGIYLLMRFADAASQSPLWSVMLICIGLFTAVMGALFALQRTDLKELMAYSTVSQLGLLVAVIGVGTPGAMVAASVHVVAHALFKSAAFMYVGLLERRVGTRDIRSLHGLARLMPWESAMITVAVISMAGLPPAVGFVSKEGILDAMLQAPGGALVGWTAALVAAAGAVLTVSYSARVVVTTLPGAPGDLRTRRGGGLMTFAVSVTALAGAAIGVGVWLMDDLVGSAAEAASGAAASDIPGLYLWHGVNAALILSALAITFGILMTVRRDGVDQLLDRPLFPGTGVAATQWLQDATISTGRRVGDLTRHDSARSNLLLPVAIIGSGSLGLWALWQGWPTESSVTWIDAGLLLVMLGGVATVVSTGRRLTSIVAAGVVGFSVALWFFTLGAADVALTQFLVEILTVVIMVLVVRRMSLRFPARRATAAAATLALLAGVAATVATLTFTGHRGLSPAGEYFLREAEEETGGTNVVNTILVDFRALDTLGELVVLAIGALAVSALLSARRLVERPRPVRRTTSVSDPVSNSVFIGVLDRVLVPLMLGGSMYALLRGHSAPGGGFIAALIGASALALAYLAASTDDTPRLNRPYLAIAGSGILVAVGSGLLGLVEGSFLRPLHADILGMHLSSALVFDLGVYLAVFGVILAALNLLGTSSGRAESPARRFAASPDGDDEAGSTVPPTAEVKR